MNKEQQITKNNTLLNNLNKAKKTLKKYKSEYKLNKLDIINHILCYIGILIIRKSIFLCFECYCFIKYLYSYYFNIFNSFNYYKFIILWGNSNWQIY